MVEISKADWKLFRERIGDWQERYMERLSSSKWLYGIYKWNLSSFLNGRRICRNIQNNRKE